ncbi:retrovirus-related pol polyprotein from transposon TNT 1-94 [Tanacetum coccineum]|uniref:Retrovirus-related pol polyprotein from transposon TNT 1-94 n=1 Tax=Tanacetum coccineum TaxID=301880 RepID=A0ABQ5ATE6_9ASTR
MSQPEGFNNSRRDQFDNCVYSKKVSRDSYVYLLLYVDDMLVAAKNMVVINDLKALLKSKFEMKDLGATKKTLGIDKEVKYLKTVPYSSAVRSLMYVMVCTRQDLAHAVSVVTRFIANPGKAHWKVVKWILRYIKGASNICLVYDGKGHGNGLIGYVDSDYDAKNLMYHERTKHIDVRLTFIRDILEEDKFSIQKIATEHNPADMLTKEVKFLWGIWCMKETTKRDTKEPLVVGEILSVKKVLVSTISSLNYPTSNVEDAFSSNFPNYLSVSLNYFPASPRKTYSSSSNSFGVVPIASPTLSLFHDDPYMKVLQAFYIENSPIPPPTIIPPTSIPNP